MEQSPAADAVSSTDTTNSLGGSPSKKRRAMLEADSITLPLVQFKEILRRALLYGSLEWSHVPATLRNDRDLVLACLEGGRLVWEQLSNETKSDPRIVVRVLTEECWDPVNRRKKSIMWRELPASIQSDLDIMGLALRYKRVEWSEVPEVIKQNHLSIAQFGFEEGYTTLDDCACLQDRDFLKHMISEGNINWKQLPTHLRDDVNFARNIFEFEDVRTVKAIFEHLPELARDRQYWINLLETLSPENDWSDELYRILSRCAPAEILADFAVMQIAITKELFFAIESLCFALVDSSLKARHEFMDSLVEERPTLLAELTCEEMRNCADLVREKLGDYANWFCTTASCNEDDFEVVARFAYKIPPEFWQDRSFVLEWFTAGLPLIATNRDGSEFISKWQNDEEIFLLLAKESGPYIQLGDWCQISFQSASAALCSNKKFMLEVVKHDPSLLRFAPIDLQKDFDLALTAFSGESDLVMRYFDPMYPSYEGRDEFVFQFVATIHELEEMSETYTISVLPLIRGSQLGNISSLSMLNQGAETSNGYMNRLMDFLVPTSEQMTMIRLARSNLPEFPLLLRRRHSSTRRNSF